MIIAVTSPVICSGCFIDIGAMKGLDPHAPEAQDPKSLRGYQLRHSQQE